VAVSRENVSGPSKFVQLSDCQLLKNNFALWSEISGFHGSDDSSRDLDLSSCDAV
jgi:hypothetical protein